jgi:NAD(P)-dependent dehydrogenase (short-subunit alcohol dehydrogenase family)
MRCTVLTGVSRGLGAALFDELLTSGDRVLALGRRFTAAQRAAARAAPGRIELRRADLADALSLPTAAELAAFADGAAQVVMVHNAAVIEPLGAIGTLRTDQVVRAVTVNITAPILLTNALLANLPVPLEIDQQLVTVLFVSSGAAHRVSGGRAVYSASKAAGEMFFKTLTAEYEGDGRVRVAIVDPGIMDTGMQARLRRHTRHGGFLPGGDRFIRLAEQGMLPSPEEVARKIAEEHFHRDPVT